MLSQIYTATNANPVRGAIVEHNALRLGGLAKAYWTIIIVVLGVTTRKLLIDALAFVQSKRYAVRVVTVDG